MGRFFARRSGKSGYMNSYQRLVPIAMTNSALTLEMNNLPNATSSPVFSDASNAVSRVKPPAEMSGRGAQIVRRKSFD